ncbi:MAG: phosphotransferase family protein [Pseudomonadota bacterium]|nr:phosphotransferase family protein [Pseudomonadota bacterium]
MSAIRAEAEAEARRLVRSEWGADHDIRDFGPMADGHAGLSFGFRIVQGERTVDDVVLRLAPKGVRRAGNTDVYRQAPLLRALHAAGVRVPPVVMAQESEDWFSVPFVMTRKLPGRTMIIWEPGDEFRTRPGLIREGWLTSAAALADIHRFDWQAHLPDWEKPRDLDAEIARWRPILEKTDEPDWIAAGLEVADMIAASTPPPSPVGLLHGDFQPGNVLFDQGEIVAFLDWELAGIGPQLLDIGWLLMMGDPESWEPSWAAREVPTGAELVAAYEGAMGQHFPGIPWYQALSNYIFGVISCLNVKLHRTGRRPDPMWDDIAPSVPYLFGKAKTLLR